MSTPAYSPTPTPGRVPNVENVAPVRGGPAPRTDYSKIVEQYRNDIMVNRITPGLAKLDELRQESNNSPELRKLYDDITKFMKQHFCNESGIFNTLGLGGKKRKTRRKIWRSK